MKEKEFIYERILCYIGRMPRPVIVGVNGIDTSGKTVFAENLADYLESQGQKVQPIHLDDFHHPSEIRRKGSSEVEAYYQNAFNLEVLVRELLQPIKEGRTFIKELCLLDLEKDAYSNMKSYTVTQDAIVILEGVLLFREPVLPYLDVKIYLDIPFDEMLKRAALRDVPLFGAEMLQKYRNKYIPLQQKYIALCGPKEISDFVIDNTHFEAPKLIKCKENR